MYVRTSECARITQRRAASLRSRAWHLIYSLFLSRGTHDTCPRHDTSSAPLCVASSFATSSSIPVVPFFSSSLVRALRPFRVFPPFFSLSHILSLPSWPSFCRLFLPRLPDRSLGVGVCGASSVCVYTPLSISLSPPVLCVPPVGVSLTASGSVCVTCAQRANQDGRRFRNGDVSLPGDCGLQKAAARLRRGKRRDQEVALRIRYLDFYIERRRVNSSSRASNLATRHDTLVVVGDFIRSLARSL